MSHDPDQQLSELRNAIDATDNELIEIIARRAKLTAAVGETKRALKQPLYVPQRERSLIKARRSKAKEAGLSEDLIEDVIRRIIRESYRTQTAQAAATSTQLERPVFVFGGKGALGARLVSQLRQTGYSVITIDKDDDWPDKDDLSQAQLVLMSVPVNKTVELIKQLPPLAEDCVLADVTSIKAAPLNAMLAQHSGPVVGLHPMFGPSVQNLAKQLVVVTHGRQPERYQWLLDQFVNWGAHLHEVNADKHDDAMGWIQAMRHLSTFAYGVHLANERVDIKELLELSSPIYRMELMMIGRLFAQNAELYADIIAANKGQFASIRRYLQQFSAIIDDIENGKKSDFISLFDEVSQYFGEFSSQFLKESESLVQLADDQRLKHQ
ncbi:UNVERIFIED_ORG: chorismate mutase/prephenate dehydrogenase [Idiomarina abyssalis]|jgi:chorismate mutase/prephenate dehydrogenase|uniref:T-protein n=1 Tax=Idiomarina loihiensis (strain ATCC BAA-735 / DSM 15497 / L2-TR) TaxID=283942 RepID=Q5QUU3_IDILO|nr:MULTISPECIES: bifunctional chorismate mutase/prephenate dehydrogenase [Idiomarina]AAV82554.1 Chorismate mutase-T [Idiomarina loihiensis L2TR]AGM36595.1 bifunctional chorismate mutase/prephenate dehydrogenase [Idiomarina loihiensis GSL 199]MBL4857441.1 bifunctional chorismate mutase/prephenate dehydrogenase [Idiomarina sp.]TDO53995.1 chorismate mutase/prephenate dehydrogenase [Idiomarina sp. 017G]